MPLYKEIEKEFALAVSENGGEPFDRTKLKLLSEMIAKHPTITEKERISIRLYFQTKNGSLKGLAEWAKKLN